MNIRCGRPPGFFPEPLGALPLPGGLFPPVGRALGLGPPRGALLCLGVLGPPLRLTCFVCAMVGFKSLECTQNGATLASS